MKNIYLTLILIATNLIVFSQNVGINSTGAAPAASAMLDIVATDKGILIPRVALTMTNVAAPVVAPATYLTVFNTATAGDVTPGMYYWDGAKWVRMLSGNSAWQILGNAGTVAATNFLGTTDNINLRFRTNNTERFEINTSGQLLSFDLGTAALPSYTFQGDPNTGIYSPLADNLSVTTSGTERMRVEADGDVGIGVTPDASAKLHISATNRGLLIPNVALTAINAAGPIASPATSLLVYNTATAGASPNNVVPGYYYNSNTPAAPIWKRFATGNGDAWLTTGNAGTVAATNFLGTTDNINLRFRTNNTERFEMNTNGQFLSFGLGTAALPTYTFQTDPNTGIWSPAADMIAYSTNGAERMRMLTNGEVVVGATITAIADDLFSGVGNAVLDWAVNGYSGAVGTNGGGVYGMIQNGGTTLYAGVQGEYYGTNTSGAGVRGLVGNATAGTAWNTVVSGVNGSVAGAGATGSYKMGVYGSGGLSRRSGGVMGYDFGLAIGALGYYANNGNDYSVYGFGQAHTNGLAGGIINNPNSSQENSNENIYVNTSNWVGMENNSNIGLGIYGGVMGGWIKGLAYGANFSGGLYGTYTDGKAIMNDVLVNLTDVGEENRVASYGITSTSVDVYSKGKAQLVNGQLFVEFDRDFKKLINNDPNVVVTVSPLGDCNGLYINNLDGNGFTVKELQNGNSNVQFSWIAVGTRTGSENVKISPEIISKNFDSKMNGVMYNDNNNDNTQMPIWWDGNKVSFDPRPERIIPQSEIDKANSLKRQF